jgi:hypothetical protein
MAGDVRDAGEAPVVVAEGGLAHLREIEAALGAAGIAARIVRPPPAQCSS